MSIPTIFSTLALSDSASGYKLNYNDRTLTFERINDNELREKASSTIYDVSTLGIARKATRNPRTSVAVTPVQTERIASEHTRKRDPAPVPAAAMVLHIKRSPLHIVGDRAAQQSFRVGCDHRIYTTRALQRGTTIRSEEYTKNPQIHALTSFAASRMARRWSPYVRDNITAIDMIQNTQYTMLERRCKWTKQVIGNTTVLELTANAPPGSVCVT